MTDLDPRWRNLAQSQHVCPSCGVIHDGLFDLATGAPSQWTSGIPPRPNSQISLEGDFLSEDFCVLEGQYFFIRCQLRLPLVGAEDDAFAFGIWCSLSADNFKLYLDHFDDDAAIALGPWFGWFCNRLLGYPETLGLKAHVLPQDHRQRPSVTLEPTDHPLSVEQRQGITYDRLMELYDLYGHGVGEIGQNGAKGH